MRFAIRYLTQYRYDGPVEDNLNVLRIMPATDGAQLCEEFTLQVDPRAHVSRHRDHFGTEVIELGVAAAHEQLTIDANARVRTVAAPVPAAGPWEALAGEGYRERAAEYLQDGRAVDEAEAFERLLAAIDAPAPLETVRRLVQVIPDRLDYRPGATYVGSTVDDLLAGGAGVCQDFVHLSLMLLRRRGIAARYVSGYLFAAPEGDGPDSVEVATHAWLEACLPGAEGPARRAGWLGADPTNRKLADENYVRIGHGRAYGDLPPIKGNYRGGARATMEAKVRMTRIDGGDDGR